MRVSRPIDSGILEGFLSVPGISCYPFVYRLWVHESLVWPRSTPLKLRGAWNSAFPLPPKIPNLRFFTPHRLDRRSPPSKALIPSAHFLSLRPEDYTPCVEPPCSERAVGVNTARRAPSPCTRNQSSQLPRASTCASSPSRPSTGCLRQHPTSAASRRRVAPASAVTSGSR